jgi:tRNA threonylcarbamoyladenosine biosynthesis protein TsaB
MRILHIETASEVCSAALSENSAVLVEKICKKTQSHAIKLPVFLQEIITFADENFKMPDAVAVSAGPGSYTGLRIGVSSAKGLCYGLNIPLISIDTLQLIAAEAQKSINCPTLLCPMIDARRMEVYTALFDENLQKISPTEAKIIDENSFESELKTSKIVFCGNGVEKCKNILKSNNAIFLDNINPLSINMIQEAERKFKSNIFENTAYFEPFYLKEFLATPPKKIYI